MAKFYTIAVAVALFCLFTLSLARTPSENDDSTTTTTAMSLPISEPANTETESNSASVTTVPLTEMTFRPVNRRFDVRSKRPCRHHFKFYPTMRDRAEIPYGNDMIVASGENNDLKHGGEGRWVRLHHRHHHHHHHHDEDSDSDSDSDGDNEENDGRIKKMVFKSFDHSRFDTEKMKKMRHHFHHEHHMGGGFMRRMRKFLGYYF